MSARVPKPGTPIKSTEPLWPSLRARTRRRSITLLARRLRRRPVTQLLAIASSGLLGLFLVGAAFNQDTAIDFSDTTIIAVARQDLAIGQIIHPESLDSETYPETLVPDGIMAHPAGATVKEPINAGEPIVASRVTSSDTGGPADFLTPDHVAMTITPVDALPPIEPGHRVALLATFDAVQSSSPDSTFLARNNRVLAVDPEAGSVTVEVTETKAPSVARALASGSIVVALAN